MPQELVRERMLSIARGDYKPTALEPKIWVPSIRALTEFLSHDKLHKRPH